MSRNVTLSLPHAFIYRDLSNGKSRSLKYDTKSFPKELTNRIEKSEFYSCIREINLVLSPLNQTSIFNLLESIFLLLTCFISSNRMFRWTRYDAHLKRLNELIDSQNVEVFIPRGLQLLPPLRTGLRCLQIVIYDIDYYIQKQNNNTNNNNNNNLQIVEKKSSTTSPTKLPQDHQPINIVASSPLHDPIFHIDQTRSNNFNRYDSGDINSVSIQAKSPTMLLKKQQQRRHQNVNKDMNDESLNIDYKNRKNMKARTAV